MRKTATNARRTCASNTAHGVASRLRLLDDQTCGVLLRNPAKGRSASYRLAAVNGATGVTNLGVAAVAGEGR